MDSACLTCPLPDCDEDSPLCPLLGAGEITRVEHGNAKYSQETVDHARKLRADGFSYREIAERTGVNQNAIVSWCLGRSRAKQRIKRAPSGHRCGESHQRVRYSDEIVRRARLLREKEGLSYQSIGDLIGVNWRTVVDWCEYRTRISA